MALSAAIVLAAGEGTRMRSNKPKVLHAFAGKTFLNRVMDSVAALNPDTLAVVVHFQAERVAEAARSYDEQVTIVNQDDIPGTGRAVQCAMAQLTEAGTRQRDAAPSGRIPHRLRQRRHCAHHHPR